LLPVTKAQPDQTDVMIDHLVLATPDVAATSAALAADWGVTLSPGGSHVDRGTRNELTGLGAGTYLEVVGPDAGQPDPSFPRPFGVDDLTEATLVAWCARPPMPVHDAVAACRALGVDLGDDLPMSRARPDGVLLQWRLTFPLLGHPYHGTVPFLIDWLDSPHPALSLPHQCTLRTLHLTHPQADVVRAVLAAVGGDPRVEIAQGPTALAAVVETPAGFRGL
jgi:hypothetical protein